MEIASAIVAPRTRRQKPDVLAVNTRVAPNDNRVNRTRMAGLDEESGLLKPTVQKTRGLTALVVAAAALSFFAGAAAATHATTTTELWPKIPKAPKIDNFIPDWMVEDATARRRTTARSLRRSSRPSV